jgi:hypothetical protein
MAPAALQQTPTAGLAAGVYLLAIDVRRAPLSQALDQTAKLNVPVR